MKLTVVIVNYNVKYYLEQCLDALTKALRDMDAQIYVVDNCSQDLSVPYISSRFPDVRLIQSKDNLGFARANNLAIKESESEYVLLLNPDTVVGERVIAEAVDFMDAHPRAGAVGVKMLKSDGTIAKESRRGVPDPMTSFYKMCGLCACFPRHRRFGHYYLGYLPWDEPARIEIVSGAFFMVRRTALDEVGLLDKDFFMYGEDIDLSFRLCKGGWENWYLPLEILHYKGESTQRTSYRYVHVFYEAMLIFFKKHYSHVSMFWSIPVKTAIYLKAMTVLVHVQLKKLRKFLNLPIKRAKKPVCRLVVAGQYQHLCCEIAVRNGLKVCDWSNDDAHWGEDRDTYVVYDTDSHSYEEILHAFAAHPHPHVKMGIFHPKTNIIMTERGALL